MKNTYLKPANIGLDHTLKCVKASLNDKKIYIDLLLKLGSIFIVFYASLHLFATIVTLSQMHLASFMHVKSLLYCHGWYKEN